jgi:uncharacterized protein YraI
MTTRRFPAPALLAPTLLALAGIALGALPASAATAQAIDPITIFSSPHTYGQVLGKLGAGEEVTLDRCTADGTWCRVLHNGPTGWVPASYIIGASAKNDATTGRDLLTAPPIDQDSDTNHFHHHRN